MIHIFLFKKIIERINSKVPEIKHIDLWNNQIEMEAQELPFNRPAVFLEFLPVTWHTLGQKRSDADINFALHLVTDMTGIQTDSTQEEQKQNDSLYRLILFEKVWVAMQGYQANDGDTQFSKIIRNGSNIDSNSGQLNKDTLFFFTHVNDSAAVPVYTEAPLNLRISGDIVPEIPLE